ncbi:hypothetical protein GS504_00180 [Rhodococcus hoagii]|nr:hypothetical protein [Prescottella equi]
MAAWERLQECALTPEEDFAAIVALERLIPSDVAEHHYGPVEGMTVVYKRDELEELMTEPLAYVLERCESLIDEDGTLVVSPRGTLLIAELVCRKNPMPILDEVMRKRRRRDTIRRRGETEPGRRGEKESSTPPNLNMPGTCTGRDRVMRSCASGADTEQSPFRSALWRRRPK